MNINFNLLKIGILLLSAIGAQAQTSIGGLNVYYGHLHNHSNVSDGSGTPDEAYNYAKNSGGLDFFSLSDHSTAIDATEWLSIKAAAEKYNADNVFTTFYGFEWTENVLGHVTVINSTDYISTGSPTNTFAGLCNWLNSTECVAFFNHPGRNNSTNQEFEHFTTTPTDKIAGMELWNKADRFSIYYYTDGYYAADGNKSWFDEAISRGWKIGAAGGEDNHSGTWGTATTSRLAVLASAKNRTEIYNALKARRFFTTYDKNLALSFKIGSNEMGSTITSSETSFSIQASDANGETFTQVQILKNGVVLNTWTTNTSTVNISGNMIFTTGEYYYVRVLQTDNDEAISSPIWIGNVNQLPSVSLTAPLQNSNFVAPAAITISATASDADGNIQKVEFYQGATKIGEDTSNPYSFVWSAVSDGSYSLTAKAFDNLGGTNVSSAVQIVVANPGDPVTIFSKIATGMDDMEETSSNGNILANVNSTDIELVNDVSTNVGIQTVGLRFVNLNIPQGALISNAYIQFTCDETSTAACNLTISGENVDNSAAFTTVDYNVSSRTKTIARVNWIPAAWSTLNEAGINQRTPNISNVIQEIVSRTGYVSSGAISFIFNGTGARIADSYNGSPAQAAVLYVTYTIPTVNQPPVVSITSPSNNSTFTAPATIPISANATDADGNITNVDFFQGGNLLGSDNTSPFSYNWSGVSVGTYSITAVATDNLGATTTASVSVTVNPAPVVISNVQAVNTSETSATITWTTDFASSSEVEYGLTTSYGSPANIAGNVTSHSVPLTGLTSGTLYHYRVKSNGVYSGDYTFTTKVPVVVSSAYSPVSTTITTGTISLGSADNLAISDNIYYSVNSTKVKPFISDWYGAFQIQDVSNILRFTVKYEGKYSRSVNQILYLWNFISNSWVQIDARTVSTVDIPVTYIQNAPANFISTNGEIRVRVYATTSSKSFACSGDLMQIMVERQSASQFAAKSGQIDSPVILEDMEDKLVLFPNPVSDVLNIELQGFEKNELTTVEILNIAGIRMKSHNFSGVKTQLNLVDLPSGIYFVKVKTSSNMYLRKIIRN